jgi:hypothetical protein
MSSASVPFLLIPETEGPTKLSIKCLRIGVKDENVN